MYNFVDCCFFFKKKSFLERHIRVRSPYARRFGIESVGCVCECVSVCVCVRFCFYIVACCVLNGVVICVLCSN